MVAAPNSLFEVGPGSAEICNKITFRPRVDAYYDDGGKKLVLFFDLPGFEKKDVEIEFDDGGIVVSGTCCSTGAYIGAGHGHARSREFP